MPGLEVRAAESGKLVPVLEEWWQSFSGPFLYYRAARPCRRRCVRLSIS